jgi:hypothetical protein
VSKAQACSAPPLACPVAPDVAELAGDAEAGALVEVDGWPLAVAAGVVLADVVLVAGGDDAAGEPQAATPMARTTRTKVRRIPKYLHDSARTLTPSDEIRMGCLAAHAGTQFTSSRRG